MAYRADLISKEDDAGGWDTFVLFEHLPAVLRVKII